MSVNLRAFALSLVMLSSVFSFATLATPQGAQAASDNETCPPYERKAQLSSKPLLVNPGGKCFARFRFEIMLASSSARPPEICYFARAVGSEKEYGPFCSGGANMRVAMPGPIEWLWSSKPVTIYIKLCAAASDCQ